MEEKVGEVKVQIELENFVDSIDILRAGQDETFEDLW
jgi:hypothetical protein